MIPITRPQLPPLEDYVDASPRGLGLSHAVELRDSRSSSKRKPSVILTSHTHSRSPRATSV